MDPEFQRLVDAAVEVAASGRWEAVNDRIKTLAANPGPALRRFCRVRAAYAYFFLPSLTSAFFCSR